MAVTAKRARTLALSLAGTTSYPHFDRLAFRLPRRTFATLSLDGGDMNLMFDLEQQTHFCELAPLAIAPVPGGWGRMGWTRCDLKKIDATTFATALGAAHALANVPRSRKIAARSTARSNVAASKIAPSKTAGPRRPKKSR